MGVKLFVWDFHGVLEKYNEYGVQEIFNKVLSEFSINKRATVKDCVELYGKRWADYFRKFADVDEKQIYSMVNRANAVSITEKPGLKYIKPMDHAHDVLDKIKKKGHMNIILSNSSQKALAYFLESVQMNSIFEHEYGADDHKDINLENPKEIWLKEFLNKNKFDK